MPIDVITKEHELISRIMSVTGLLCSRIDDDCNVPLDHVVAITDFIHNFINTYHHYKEEKLLFPALINAGVPMKDGYITALERDHDLGKTYARAADASLSLFMNGKRKTLSEFSRYANDFRIHYSIHMLKENDILYTMAEQHLSADQKKILHEGFDRVDNLENFREIIKSSQRIVFALQAEYLDRAG